MKFYIIMMIMNYIDVDEWIIISLKYDIGLDDKIL